MNKYCLDENIKKIIEENAKLIDESNFDEIYSKIINKHHFEECDKVFEIFSKVDIIEDKNSFIRNYHMMNRIRQIKCYNVGFGDCFLCKDKNECGATMLVDFGGETKKLIKVASDLIREFSSSKRKYLMLSHLHGDHFCGLKLLQGKVVFDEVYLPNYIANYGIEILGEVLLTSTNSTLINLVKEILKIPGLLYGFVTNTTRVHLLLEGSSIYNSLCAFDVLLPYKNSSCYNSNKILPYFVRAKIEEFVEEYKKLISYEESENNHAVISIHNDNLVNKIEALIEKILWEREKVDLYINQNELKERFKDYHNALSIAFHEKYVKDDENVLFLGDTEPKDINYLVDNNKLNNEYCFVKVQHHGTKNYFYNKLPKANWFAISNGGNRQSWKITKDYDYQYGKSTNFICTNNCNCEKFKNNIICDAYKNLNTQCGVNLSYTVKI